MLAVQRISSNCPKFGSERREDRGAEDREGRGDHIWAHLGRDILAQPRPGPPPVTSQPILDPSPGLWLVRGQAILASDWLRASTLQVCWSPSLPTIWVFSPVSLWILTDGFCLLWFPFPAVGFSPTNCYRDKNRTNNYLDLGGKVQSRIKKTEVSWLFNIINVSNDIFLLLKLS